MNVSSRDHHNEVSCHAWRKGRVPGQDRRERETTRKGGRRGGRAFVMGRKKTKRSKKKIRGGPTKHCMYFSSYIADPARYIAMDK